MTNTIKTLAKLSCSHAAMHAMINMEEWQTIRDARDFAGKLVAFASQPPRQFQPIRGVQRR